LNNYEFLIRNGLGGFIYLYLRVFDKGLISINNNRKPDLSESIKGI